MRVAPIAVFAAGDIEHTLDLARRSALVRHTHPGSGWSGGAGVRGGVRIAAGRRGELSVSPLMQEQLDRVEVMPAAATPDDVAYQIGHGVDALSSVPAARAVGQVGR